MEIVYPFESNFAIWGRIISEIQSIPIQHRARYQALTQIVLLLGPITLLRFNTTIINDLIQAIKYREVCSTGTLLLSKILESCIIELSSDMDRPQRIQAVRNLWDEASISMICSDDERVQVNANDYLIPAILQIDSTCVAHLLAMIRKHLSMKLDNYRTSLGLRTNADNVVVTHSRAIISVVMYARKFGLAGKEIVQENDMVGTVYLTEGEIIACCVSADSNLCLNAFALLTTSNRTSEPMRKHEVSILQRCLHYCLKSSEADHRHRLLKALKDMLVRVKESCRIATRDLQKLQMKATKSTVSEDEMQALKSIIDVGDEIVVWLLKEVMRNLFPGAPFDRELIGLEIVACVLDTLGENDELVKKIFLSADLYLSLVNLLVSSWDRTRKMASDLLLRFPTPPTQFENPEKLVKWGLQLTSSPRLREADAGAFVLKNVYSAYCVKLCQSVKLSAVDTDSQITTWLCLDALHSIPLFQFSSQEFRKAEFLIRMTYTIGQRLKALDGLFTMVDIGKILQTNLEEDVDESGNCINIDDVALPLDEDSTDDVPLCNGLILALRICLSDDPSSFHSPLVIENNGMMNLWRIIFRKIYEQAIAAMQLGMRVVAEAATDVPFAPTNSDLAVTNPESDNSSKGPVNTATISMAASYVNANSLVNTDCNSDVGVTLKRKVQMCVVGAWLLVKESCQMLAHLVALAPIPSVNPEGIQRNLLLSSEEIEKAGWQIIEGLGRLKHMGAIAEAHAALHSIAATLLRYVL